MNNLVSIAVENPLYEKNLVPSFDSMFKPILIALKQLNNSATTKALDAKVVEVMGISKEIASIPHGYNRDRTEISYRLAWARTYLKKYGLITNTTRGIWSFTKSYDGNIDAIDSTLITQSVRNGSLGVFSNPNISNLESHNAFEKFTIGVLTDYLKRQNKEVRVQSIVDDAGYDLLLPQGLDEYNLPIYVEIKYGQYGNNTYEKIIKSTYMRLSMTIKPQCILFIFGTMLSKPTKIVLKREAEKELGTRILIWDYFDLEELANPESSYIDYWVNPRKALVGETIATEPTEEQSSKRKQELIELLGRAYQNQNVTLFLGAGISIDAGVPLWTELINKLLIRMVMENTKEKPLSKFERETINQLACSNKENSPLAQMRYIKEAFSSEDYYRFVHDSLYSVKLNARTELLKIIVSICTPRRNHIGVKSVITYNFDNLLEEALRVSKIDYNIIFRESDITNNDSLNIYHVHGYLPRNFGNEFPTDEMNLVFSEEDYHKVYRDAYCWSNIAQLNAFRESTCLFIGCSLNDPNLRRLLDVAARQGESPRHYAILKREYNVGKNEEGISESLLRIYKSMDDKIRQSYFQSLGLNIIWVDEYAEIPSILNGLQQRERN